MTGVAMSEGSRQSNRGRTMARRRAMQAIYQWQHTGQEVQDIEAQFIAEQDMSQVEVPYFRELLKEALSHISELDTYLTPYLDRVVEQVDPVERAILRIGAYELAYRRDVPYRVIINEGVELAKVFGAEQSHKYINGVLDKVARKLRSVELTMNSH